MNQRVRNTLTLYTERSKYSRNSLSSIKLQKRRAHLARRIKEWKLIGIGLLLAIVFMGILHLNSDKVQAEANYVKKIISIEIQEGDTLWGYAEKYANTDYYDSKQQYINEVYTLNGLKSDQIYAGRSLAIPVVRIPESKEK